MPLPAYHIREQHADALLNPVRLAVTDLERRLQHYLDRIPMDVEDYQRVGRARGVLERARRELEQVIGEHSGSHHDDGQ